MSRKLVFACPPPLSAPPVMVVRPTIRGVPASAFPFESPLKSIENVLSRNVKRKLSMSDLRNPIKASKVGNEIISRNNHFKEQSLRLTVLKRSARRSDLNFREESEPKKRLKVETLDSEKSDSRRRHIEKHRIESRKNRQFSVSDEMEKLNFHHMMIEKYCFDLEKNNSQLKNDLKEANMKMIELQAKHDAKFDHAARTIFESTEIAMKFSKLEADLIWSQYELEKKDGEISVLKKIVSVAETSAKHKLTKAERLIEEKNATIDTLTTELKKEKYRSILLQEQVATVPPKFPAVDPEAPTLKSVGDMKVRRAGRQEVEKLAMYTRTLSNLTDALNSIAKGDVPSPDILFGDFATYKEVLTTEDLLVDTKLKVLQDKIASLQQLTWKKSIEKNLNAIAMRC